MRTSARRSLQWCLGVAATMAAVLWWPRPIAAAATNRVPLQLDAGEHADVTVGVHRLRIAVPRGPEESASLGTFRLTSEDGAFDSGPLPRDGGVEECLVGDLDSDRQQDAVLVVRSAGSGSYVELFVVGQSAKGLSVQQLPQPDARLLHDTRGHDAIDIVDGVLHRTVPVYVDTSGVRVDRNWQPGDALRGRLPVKADPDSNSGPSGGHRVLVFDVAARRWRVAG